LVKKEFTGTQTEWGLPNPPLISLRQGDYTKKHLNIVEYLNVIKQTKASYLIKTPIDV
jgi:hypothetical protein